MSSSQLAIVQTYKVQTNGNSTASKAKKPSHSSHSISVYCNNTSANYCNIFAYLRITYNTSGACLNLPEWNQFKVHNPALTKKSMYRGDYKHWTWDPRTEDPRTWRPEDRGPKDQGPNDLPLLHLAFMTEMQLLSML